MTPRKSRSAATPFFMKGGQWREYHGKPVSA